MTTIYEFVASSVIGTPLQRPAEAVRSLIALRRRKRPESREVLLEYERTRMILRRVVTPEMNCVAVDCHLGSVLDHIVRLAPRGRHIAIEPLPYKAA